MKKELQDKIYGLIALKMAGSADFEQLQELEQLLKLYPEFKQLDDVLGHFPRIDESVTKDITDQAFATQYVKMLYAQQEHQVAPLVSQGPATRLKRSKRVFLKPAAIAASIILLFTFFKADFFSDEQASLSEKPATQKDTVTSGKSKLTLPDGTLVYLNANSHLEYGQDFNTAARDVILTGEAYFDVAHNPRKPFIVHTSKATIRVLGTRFNVKNYADATWEATLLQGKIEMYLNNKPKNKLTLEPSQKVSVSALEEQSGSHLGDFKISVTKIKPLKDDIAETAWMENKLVFVDQPLQEIAKELEREFGVTVHFKSDKSGNNRYTGAFKNDDLQQILEILDLSNPIDYELKENQLIIQ
ncbi:FecR domain-containing protein [Niabella yanshanensis]|uniref:FecR domain-containing protein n=1 Tax=Niabella yanshanensis TaxID=577386 RepID=A0ABZ0WAU0_9BACT|nr:FecR domain-containing protein [Niabella yanshanensis]WQD39255.1 FecR domain-containing protein [Niabella yanshanensis]